MKSLFIKAVIYGIIFIGLGSQPPGLYAQEQGFVLIEGLIFVNNQPLEGANINVFVNHKKIDQKKSLKKGNFECKFRFNEVYQLEISKFGFVTKKFDFNTEIPAGEPTDQIYNFPLQVDLFPPFEEVDMSILDNPLADIAFDRETKMFSFDLAAATETVKRVQKLQNEILLILEAKAKLFKKEFDNAEIAFRQKNYKISLDDYQKALNVYPESSAELYCDVDYIKKRIETINKYLAERETKEKEKARGKEYDLAIDKADKLYEKKVYDEAMDAYQKAMEIKPDQNYPKKRINQINTMISDNIFLNLNTSQTTISDKTEKKLSFKPIKSYQKKGNYLLLKVKSTGSNNCNLFVKFGKDDETGAGIVLKNIRKDDFNNYLIRISAQDKWFRMDANWISLYPEGGDIEIREVAISRDQQ